MAALKGKRSQAREARGAFLARDVDESRGE